MKKYFLNLMAAAMMVATVTFVSCDENGVEEPTVSENNLSGSITETKVLDANTVYTITGPVIVEEGGVLDIPAGTTIKAQKGFSNYILVLQGGKIYVRGTASQPVRMTADVDNAQQGYWGGLIINGRAPISGSGTGSTEINSAYVYGGDDAADNSGEITYLILEYTGARSSADVEHNGLTLNGVGNGTKIENVFVPNGADDAIEFFGGTVNVKNFLAVNPDDDMFDFTQGYSGTLENAYGIWDADYVSTEEDPRGIEADGNLDGLSPDEAGQSDFKVLNVTFDLRLAVSQDEGHYMHDVIKVRRGAKATITNALVTGKGQAKDLIDLTDGKGDGNTASVISLTNSLETAVSGKEINPADGYADVKVEAGNTGCPTDIFSWTGYAF